MRVATERQDGDVVVTRSSSVTSAPSRALTSPSRRVTSSRARNSSSAMSSAASVSATPASRTPPRLIVATRSSRYFASERMYSGAASVRTVSVWPRMVSSTRAASLKVELPDVLQQHVDLPEHLAALIAELAHLTLELRVLVAEALDVTGEARVLLPQTRLRLDRLPDRSLQLSEPRRQ